MIKVVNYENWTLSHTDMLSLQSGRERGVGNVWCVPESA